MRKDILVVGGAGYIGSHMCKHLFKSGYQPIVLDNLVCGHRQAVKWGPFFNPSIPSTVSYDVTPSGPGGTRCFDGTIDFDAVDETIGGDLCVGDPIPALSQWGLVCMTLLLLAVASVLLGRGRSHRDPMCP